MSDSSLITDCLGWNHEGLYAKAYVFMDRAFKCDDREGQEFPLWCSLALEVLCRASLAKVHPALLAEVKPNDRGNILHACGFTTDQPKSITMTEVLERCKVVCPDFTNEEFKICKAMVEARNEEVHSASAAFVTFKLSYWLPRVYKVLRVLLTHQGRTLHEFIGAKEATAAEKMIESLLADRRKEAYELVRLARERFESLPKAERDVHRRVAGSFHSVYDSLTTGSREIVCPACHARARMAGQIVTRSGPKVIDGELLDELVCLPTKVWCHSCGLMLGGHDLLHALDIGGQYSVWSAVDPMSYFASDKGDEWTSVEEVEELERLLEANATATSTPPTPEQGTSQPRTQPEPER